MHKYKRLIEFNNIYDYKKIKIQTLNKNEDNYKKIIVLILFIYIVLLYLE